MHIEAKNHWQNKSLRSSQQKFSHCQNSSTHYYLKNWPRNMQAKKLRKSIYWNPGTTNLSGLRSPEGCFWFCRAMDSILEERILSLWWGSCWTHIPDWSFCRLLLSFRIDMLIQWLCESCSRWTITMTVRSTTETSRIQILWRHCFKWMRKVTSIKFETTSPMSISTCFIVDFGSWTQITISL